ncbi:MAG: hypothetical protein KGZ87_05135 [Bacteroidetes bacterium]|nr:hypothetical protein [Bacteroidota bacterium]
MEKSKTLKWTLISICGIGMVLTSFTVLYELLIPDICYYHTHEMNSFLNLFYSAGPASNGHPEPNILNFILSLLVGGIIGNGIYKLLTKKTELKIKTTANNV